jgi:hypothetical protein
MPLVSRRTRGTDTQKAGVDCHNNRRGGHQHGPQGRREKDTQAVEVSTGPLGDGHVTLRTHCRDHEGAGIWNPTSSGGISGTPAYMGQAQGRPPTQASDVFSFGLILSARSRGSSAYERANSLGLVPSLLFEGKGPARSADEQKVAPGPKNGASSALHNPPSGSRDPSAWEDHGDTQGVSAAGEGPVPVRRVVT